MEYRVWSDYRIYLETNVSCAADVNVHVQAGMWQCSPLALRIVYVCARMYMCVCVCHSVTACIYFVGASLCVWSSASRSERTGWLLVACKVYEAVRVGMVRCTVCISSK